MQFKDITKLDLDSNKIMNFSKTALVGLTKFESVCLYGNPIPPNALNGICATNPSCQVYIKTKCG